MDPQVTARLAFSPAEEPSLIVLRWLHSQVAKKGRIWVDVGPLSPNWACVIAFSWVLSRGANGEYCGYSHTGAQLRKHAFGLLKQRKEGQHPSQGAPVSAEKRAAEKPAGQQRGEE